jgi:polynucleotide 5'-kinase involved in rRNA processing
MGTFNKQNRTCLKKNVKNTLSIIYNEDHDHKKSVQEDAAKKLEKIWMEFKEIQLYTLSTKEALWIQQNDLIVGRFEKILQGIINLLEALT